MVACTDNATDRAYLQKEGLDPHVLPAPGRSPLAWLRNALAARRLLRSFPPDAVFSKGGSVSVPLCWLAHRRTIPVILHESDAVMGRANRCVARFANAVCLGFPSPQSPVPSPVLTGNPIRPEITRGKKEQGLRISGLSGTRPILLVIGGSQGAQAINQIIIEKLDDLLRIVDVIHITGQGKSGASPRSGYYAIPFTFDTLPHLYACSDIAVSRAGAGTLGELMANGIPTLVVPLRGLAQDHQMANASIAQQQAGCLLMHQEMLRNELIPAVQSLAESPAKRAEIAAQMRGFAKKDAADQITKVIREALHV